MRSSTISPLQLRRSHRFGFWAVAFAFATVMAFTTVPSAIAFGVVLAVHFLAYVPRVVRSLRTVTRGGGLRWPWLDRETGAGGVWPGGKEMVSPGQSSSRGSATSRMTSAVDSIRRCAMPAPVDRAEAGRGP
jgi:hypothetical protein